MVSLRIFKSKGKTYYGVVKTFRENGIVRQKVLCYIGNEAKLSQFLENKASAADFLSSDLENLLYQTPVSLWKILEQLNIPTFLSSHFKNKKWGVDAGIASAIMIINYAIDHKSKNKLQDWYSQTYLKQLLGLPSQKINRDLLYRTLDNFNEENIEKMHLEIFNSMREKLNLSNETLFYDLTAVTFEGETVEMAKRGHNAAHSYNPQINVGLAVTGEKIPIAHKVFEGNKKDVQTVEKIIELLEKTRTLERTIFIHDRGMASDENFSLLEAKQCKYIAGMPKTKTIKDMILQLREEDFIEIKEHNISYAERERNDRRIVIFWNKKLQEDQKIIRGKRIEKIRQRLENLKKNKNRYANEKLWEKIGQTTGDMRKYFDIKINETLEFNVRAERLEELEKLEGRYAIITNTDLSAKEILEHYRDRNLVEMSFKDLKMFVDLGPVRHWKENRVLAHIFLAILAFGLRSIIELKLRRAGINISAQEAIEKLNNVRALVAGDKLLKLTGETEETRSIASIIER